MHDRRISGLTLRALAPIAIAIALASPVQAATIANALEGEWSGSGRLTLPNGKTERIRCRGSAESVTANSVRQYFNCASANKNFDFSSSLHFSGDRVSGEWWGSGRSGTLSGNASGSGMQARLSSASGQGSLSATVSGCNQSLTVTGWAKELKSLSVRLKKASC